MDDVILINFIKQELSESEMSNVEQWINSSEENERYFLKVKLLWENAGYANQDARINKEEAWAKIHSVISEEEVKINRDTGQHHYVFRRIAAAAILLISIGTITLILRFQDRVKEINWVSEITTTEKKEVILPDDSRVWLNKNTSLKYPDQFKGETRSVILSGEAFFEVYKKSRQPFRITTKNSVIQVLGTSFNVKSEAFASRVVVTVVSGKVALFDSIREDNRIVLESGDQGIIIDSGTLNKKRNVDRNFLAWKTGVLVFENTPIDTVCLELSDHFSKSIKPDGSQELLEKRLTATYDNKELDEILKILELTLDIQYKFDQDEIILYK